MNVCADIELGRIQFVCRGGSYTLRCHQATWLGDRRPYPLLTLSAVGPSTSITAVRAMMVEPSIDVQAMIRSADNEYGSWLGRQDSTGRGKLTYEAAITRLAAKAFHLVVRAKLPGLLCDSGDAALWRELSSDRFTTPLLPEWTPWIRRRLIEENLLVESRGFNASAAVLDCLDEQLDEIVSEGVADGALSITQGRTP